jgi:hypothetical protein
MFAAAKAVILVGLPLARLKSCPHTRREVQDIKVRDVKVKNAKEEVAKAPGS